jgi:hypothetical protein
MEEGERVVVGVGVTGEGCGGKANPSSSDLKWISGRPPTESKVDVTVLSIDIVVVEFIV